MTAVLLALLVLPPLWIAPTASAAPGGGWGDPMDLKTSGGTAQTVDVCADEGGHAMAVYVDFDGATYTVYARRFVSGFGWQAEVAVSNGSYASGASVACSPTGDAVVVWNYWNGSDYSLSVAWYTADVGWSAGVEAVGQGPSNWQADVAMDGNGLAYIVTLSWTGSVYLLYGTVARPNRTIDQVVRLDNSSQGVYGRPSIAAAQIGGAVVAWSGYNGTNYDGYSRRHTGNAWGSIQRLETLGGAISEPRVAVDAMGNAVATFGQDQLGWYEVWYTTSTPGSGWAPSQETGVFESFSDFAMMPSGVGYLVSVAYNGTRNVLQVARYTPGLGFSSPILSNSSFEYIDRPSIAIDAKGTIAVGHFAVAGGTYVPRVARFSGSSWFGYGSPQEDSDPLYSFAAKGAFLSDGRLVQTWLQYDSTFSYIQPRVNIQSLPDTVGPWVRLTSPLDGYVSTTPSVTVAGYTDPGATVNVNGFAATVDSRGYFQATVTLVEGGNWILAAAVDGSLQASYSSYRFITYTNPQRMLDAERAQAGRFGALDPMDIENINYWGMWWPQVEADRNGNAYAVWYENVYGNNRAYVARYVNGTGWGAPILLQGEDGYLFGAPRLAVDAGGNATIVWTVQDYGNRWAHVWAYLWRPAAGQAMLRVDTAARYAWWPDVAISPATNRAHLVWHQRDEVTGNYSVFSRQFIPPSTLSAAGRIESVVGQNELARIAFDGSGRGYMSFRTWNGSAYSLALARFDGSVWNYSAVISPGEANMWNAPIAADRGGNVSIAWHTYNGSFYQFAWRLYANNTNSGRHAVLDLTWDWDPEVMATDDGRAFVGYTADRSGQNWNAFVGVAGPGQAFSTATAQDLNSANPGGGPKFSKGWTGSPARVHFDESINGVWTGLMREYNVSNSSWGAPIMLSKPGVGAHIPDVAPMPDGGYMVVWGDDNTTLGFSQMVARRVTIFDTTAPSLTVSVPTNGSTVAVSFAELRGATEAMARVWVNNQEVVVAANGSFALTVPLTNGSNSFSVRAVDLYGNWRNITHVVVFADPALALIANLTAANAALQNQLNLTNASLWSALAAQNATLAAAIAAGDAALLAQLVAQNATLAAAISAGDAAVLAALAAQNATLAAAIAAGDAQLAADLIQLNSDLLDTIAAGDAQLLADMAAQNASLLSAIAATNASLISQLAAQNASIIGAMASLNASLLAELAAGDAALADLIGDTNASLLAELAVLDSDLRDLLATTNSDLLAALAAQNDELLALIADTNTDLLASLAAQNDDLLARIGATNASLLAELARTNATLMARLTADNNALWSSLTAANGVNAGQNVSLTDTQADAAAAQADADAAQQQAAAAGSSAMMALLLAVVAAAIGALAFLMSRKRPPMVDGHTPPPKVEGVEVVDAPASASTGAEGEPKSGGG